MVYTRKELHYLHENDEINTWEEGFMRGYLEDED